MCRYFYYAILVIDTLAEYKSLGTKSIGIPEVFKNLKLLPSVALNIALPFNLLFLCHNKIFYYELKNVQLKYH